MADAPAIGKHHRVDRLQGKSMGGRKFIDQRHRRLLAGGVGDVETGKTRSLRLRDKRGQIAG
ncbi:hypothetical protein Q644_23500 [Brucella intermedia 229E]|uniref:Uncharacterized protein n=1 Tax=Brucella intermedia 229E TaxID=1337887 RepID=U4VE36_9HYPH|nr:hypothetical protein Q644_23500 [Brucella intermedia 229E]